MDITIITLKQCVRPTIPAYGAETALQNSDNGMLNTDGVQKIS